MPAKPIKNKDVLVICVDRDNDLGVKAGISGPIVGKQANAESAAALGMKDPSDSDVNAIFYALKVYETLRGENTAEIVTLTGDVLVGAESDRKIMAQLDEILKKHSFKEAVMISDGAGDEHILPLLKTKINVISTQQVIVKQSAQLESTYYMINDFIRDTLSDRKTAQLVFGVPAVGLLLYAFFGASAIRLIIGVVGAYFLIKGFQLEKYIVNAFDAVFLSAKKRQPSCFLYLLGGAVFLFAVFTGYRAIGSASGILEEVFLFFNASIFVFFVAAALLLWGNAIPFGRPAIPAYVTYTLLVFASSWIVYELTRFGINPVIGYSGIAYSVMFSGALLAVSTLVERRLKRKRK